VQYVSSGALLGSIGILHNVVGVIMGLGVISLEGHEGRAPLAEIASAGVVNGVEPDLLRSLFFWFVFFGWLAILLGALMSWVERRGERLPAGLGYGLGALALSGGLMIPASGFWLVLPVAWLVIRRARTGALTSLRPTS